jgi:hypothetical protein
MKFNLKAFTIACGLSLGVGTFSLTWWVIAFEGSSTSSNFISSLFRGYTFTPAGSLIGLAWGLLDGGLGGFLLAWIHNRFIAGAPVRINEANLEEINKLDNEPSPRALLE